MGKKVERRATEISIERNHQGCMWGIVHALQHQPWHHVRKRMLPHRRRRVAGSENSENDINATGETQEESNAKMEIPLIEEQIRRSQSTKGSVKSRIKAFITDEMSKRRGKHRRSRSYPARMQLIRTDSIHRLQHQTFNHFNKTPIEKNYPFSNSFKNQRTISRVNSNFEKLIEKEYRKSMSFPSGRVSGKRRRIFGSMEVKTEFLLHDVIKPDTLDKSSMDVIKKDGEGKIKRFKSLKERIKHAMRESKKERHRITMDAVLHKVPYGRKFSNDERRGMADFRREKGKEKFRSFKPPQSSCFDDSLDRYRQLYFSCFNTEAKHHIEERLKLRKDEETPTSNKKNMGRLFSLPDLRLYYLLKNEDFSGLKAANESDIMKEIGKSGSVLDEMEPADLFVSPENEILFGELVKCGHKNRSATLSDSNIVLESEVGSTSFVDFKVESLEGLGLDDLEGLTTTDEYVEQSESSPVSLLDSTVEKMATSNTSIFPEDADLGLKHISIDEESSTRSLPNQKFETNTIKKFNSELLHIPVDSKDVPKYNFVKYVLELSGFSENESLEAWHSPQQPLDPLMFEEFYEEDQHDENRDKLLLFDLVNEVLLEIYERSFAYCPIRLCSISYTRPVPMGRHVLEEVWDKISLHLEYKAEVNQLLDEAISRDLNKHDEWMNLHFEAECVGLELEDMIFDDLLEELVST